MDQVPLIVLGADLDGLVGALALAHQGFPVHLLERGARAGGAPDAVALVPAAVQELVALGFRDVLADSTAEPSEVVHADGRSGSVLRKIGLVPAVRERFGQPYLTARRSDLRALLVAACDADEMIQVEYDQRISSVEDLGEAALVTTVAGRRYRAEALVAADGPASRVRGLLGGGHATSLPFVVRVGPGPSTVGAASLRLWSSSTLLVAQMPVAGQASAVVVVVRGDHYDEMRHREGDGALSSLLAGYHPDVRAVAAGALDGDGMRIFRHHQPLDHWTRHRITVLGSAGSPMLPHAAFGGSAAFVDAGALGTAFDRSDGRILHALDLYSRSRARASARIAERSHEFAVLCHAEGLLRRVRDQLWAGTPVDGLAALAGMRGSR